MTVNTSPVADFNRYNLVEQNQISFILAAQDTMALEGQALEQEALSEAIRYALFSLRIREHLGLLF